MILLWERYASAMVFLWGRIRAAVWWLIHGPAKPKKERLLFDWEVRAIERECGIGLDEPGYQPTPEVVAILNEDPVYAGSLHEPYPLPIDAAASWTGAIQFADLRTLTRLNEQPGCVVAPIKKERR